MRAKNSSRLKYSRWYDITSQGNMRIIRVSAKMEAQFPKKYRKTLRDLGAAAATKEIMLDKSLSLSAAWEELQKMVNS